MDRDQQSSVQARMSERDPINYNIILFYHYLVTSDSLNDGHGMPFRLLIYGARIWVKLFQGGGSVHSVCTVYINLFCLSGFIQTYVVGSYLI